VATGSADQTGFPDALYAFAVGRSGMLCSLSGSPFAVDTTEARHPVFSPDGRLLATTTGDTGADLLLSVYALTLPLAQCPGPPTPGRAPVPVDNHFTVSRVTIRANGTISLFVKVPGAGRVDVLATAWKDNLARVASLQPALGSFVYARAGKRID